MTDLDRNAALAAARRRASATGSSSSPSPRPRRSKRPGRATALATTGAAIGGGLALVGVMVASAQSNAITPASASPVQPPAASTADAPAPANQRTVVVRRVVIPTRTAEAGTASVSGSSNSAAAIRVPTAPARTTRIAPVTRSNGS